jgi:hypothetical protein
LYRSGLLPDKPEISDAPPTDRDQKMTSAMTLNDAAVVAFGIGVFLYGF